MRRRWVKKGFLCEGAAYFFISARVRCLLYAYEARRGVSGFISRQVIKLICIKHTRLFGVYVSTSSFHYSCVRVCLRYCKEININLLNIVY